jgi:hypothetical protein
VVSDQGIQLELSEMAKAPGGPAAVDVWSENSRRFSHAVVDAIYASAREEDTFGSLVQGALRLTKAEAGELAHELADVLHAWNERTRGRDPERQTYMLMQVLQLYPDLTSHDED